MANKDPKRSMRRRVATLVLAGAATICVIATALVVPTCVQVLEFGWLVHNAEARELTRDGYYLVIDEVQCASDGGVRISGRLCADAYERITDVEVIQAASTVSFRVQAVRQGQVAAVGRKVVFDLSADQAEHVSVDCDSYFTWFVPLVLQASKLLSQTKGASSTDAAVDSVRRFLQSQGGDVVEVLDTASTSALSQNCILLTAKRPASIPRLFPDRDGLSVYIWEITTSGIALRAD